MIVSERAGSTIDASRNELGQDSIPPRCLRAFREQRWYAENFLSRFLELDSYKGLSLLEIGPAEAGLLRYFREQGAHCFGMEQSTERFGYSQRLNRDVDLALILGDITRPESLQSLRAWQMDVVVLRDVIEHIADKSAALETIHDLMKPGGLFYLSFPPKEAPYSGHQQILSKQWAKLPFLHLLPSSAYKKVLEATGDSQERIRYLLETRERRISVPAMENLFARAGFEILKKSLYFLRPAYEFRFGMKPVRNRLAAVPLLGPVFTNGASYLLVKR